MLITRMRVGLAGLVVLGFALTAGLGHAYPIDGYGESGIRRLERLRRIVAGEIPGTKPVSGARK